MPGHPDRCPSCGCLLGIDWSGGHRPRCPDAPPPDPEAVPPRRSRDCPDCGERARVRQVEDHDDVVRVTFACVECASSWVEVADRDRLPPERTAVTP